ncbi:MAG: alpha/beta fold hydrolase [Planctomycetales bacterium]
MMSTNHSRTDHRRPVRVAGRVLFAVLAAAVVLAAPAAGRAQPPAAQKKTGVVREESLATGDGWRLATTYYESTAGREAPVVVLLHGKDGNRLVWNGGFAKRLQDEGYAVIAVDLRKHGQSTLPIVDALPPAGRTRVANQGLVNQDYLAMAKWDLGAIKKFIFQEHQEQKLNMRKTAIVAADMTVPIAATYSYADWLAEPYPDAPVFAAQTPKGQDVRALVLLSPEQNLPGMNTGRTYNALRAPLWNIAFLVAVGEQDAKDRGTAKRLHQQLTATAGNDARMYLKNYQTKFRGTDLFGKRLGVEEHTLAFLEQHLKRLNGEADAWRDRETKLFKD